MLWSDYFKPPHFEKYPELHQLVNDALKALSAAKGSTDPATGQKALDYIAQIDKHRRLRRQGPPGHRRRRSSRPGEPAAALRILTIGEYVEPDGVFVLTTSPTRATPPPWTAATENTPVRPTPTAPSASRNDVDRLGDLVRPRPELSG